MASVCLSSSQNWSTAVWYLLITRHPSLYLSLRAWPWLRISQSCDVDTSDVDTTLMLFAAATVCSRTDSWQWVSWNHALWTAAVAVVRKPHPTVNICSTDTRPSPKTTVACASALAWVGYGGVYPGRGQMSSTSSDDGGAYSHAPLNM